MLSAAKEKRQHGSMQVPYSYYDCRMPDYFPGVPLHWHGEMELNYIKRGTGYFQYEDRLLTAHAGDIFLIQPNLVHAILPAEQESMFYDTIVFHKNMLIGGYDDRSYTEILQPFFSARRRIQAPISSYQIHQTQELQMICSRCMKPVVLHCRELQSRNDHRYP